MIEKVVIPEQKEGGGKDPAHIDELLKASKFDLGKPPIGNDFFLKVNVEGKRYDVGGPGMIGLIVGPEKSMKTTLLKAMVASGFKQEKVLNWEIDKEFQRVGYFDTEQPDHYFWETQSEAHYLGMQLNNLRYYDAFKMRSWGGPEERIEGIERYCEVHEKVDMIVIDGILDLVTDFNDIKDVMRVGERILTLSDQSKALIILVVHTNAGQFGKNQSAIGHLGKYWLRKSDFIIQLKYNESDNFSTVRLKFGRSKPFPSWSFTRSSLGYPVLNHNQDVELPAALGYQEKGDLPF